MTSHESFPSPNTPEPSVAPWRPVPWRAAVLSLLLPGLGHVYNGRPGRAALNYVLVQVGVALFVALSFAAGTRTGRIAAIALLLVGTWVASAVDAGRVARRTAPAPRPVGARWYVLAGVWLVGQFVLAPTVFGLVTTRLVEAFRIPTGAMEPTILAGDFVLVDKRVPEPPRRGAVVIFGDSADRHFTHRVIGVPGDTLEMRHFVVHRNGRPLAEPYTIVTEREEAADTAGDFAWQRAHLVAGGRAAADSGAYRPTAGTWGPLVVPPGQYFVMGDNRANSYDSRYRGFLDRGRVVGRPAWIYFSLDADAGIRRSRVGRGIQ